MTQAPPRAAARSYRERPIGLTETEAVGDGALLVLHSVTKTYPNGNTALRDVELVVPEGDFVFLVGPSGAGKSTQYPTFHPQWGAGRYCSNEGLGPVFPPRFHDDQSALLSAVISVSSRSCASRLYWRPDPK